MFDFVTVVGSIVDALMVEFAVSNLGFLIINDIQIYLKRLFVKFF